MYLFPFTAKIKQEKAEHTQEIHCSYYYNTPILFSPSKIPESPLLPILDIVYCTKYKQ